jgi:hypothetical protein
MLRVVTVRPTAPLAPSGATAHSLRQQACRRIALPTEWKVINDKLP